MSYVFARTGDPLFLVVPEKSLLAGFGEAPPQIGTRLTGLVFNYLPWLLAALRENGDPRSETLLELQSRPEAITVGKGGVVKVRFTLRNTGRTAVEDLRASFHSRLDFQVTPVDAAGHSGSGPRVCRRAARYRAQLCDSGPPADQSDLPVQLHRLWPS